MTARRYRPAPVIVASGALHAGGLAVLAAAPAAWPAILALLVTNHAGLVLAGLLPRSRLIGPNVTRSAAAAARGAIALTFDDGPCPETTPRVLELLAARRVRASFFCIGRRAQRHPEIVRAIAGQGHRVENHSYAHGNAFWFLPWRALRRDIDRAQDLLAGLAGAPPQFFRAPAGIRSPLLEPALARAGLRLTSWTRRGFDTVDTSGARIAARLGRGLRAGDVLVLHDAGSACGADGHPVVLDALLRLFGHIEAAGLQIEPLEPDT